jgi:hypothetical protein
MVGNMNEKTIKDLVTSLYKDYYDVETQVKVTEIVFDTYGGHLAVVRGKDNNNIPLDEICFILQSGDIKIFSTTEELVRFLEHQTKLTFFDKIFTKNTMSGLVLFLLLVGVFLIGITKDFNQQALTIIGSITGMAAGYFFNNKQ